MARNFITIVQSFINFIQGTNSKIETSEGTFTRDIVIDTPAKEFENLYIRADQVSQEQSINTASEVGLEVIARNFSKVRKGARRARGAAIFYRNTTPSSDVVIPAGTIVSTQISSTIAAIQFRTTRTATMVSAMALSYLNSTTNKYEITVEIEAVNGGDAGNVGANTITAISGTVPGIDGVYNATATTGGINLETASQLQYRLSTILAGSNIGTVAGFTQYILDQDNVEDALVVGGGETGRADIGAVDIYVKGRVYRSFKDEFSDPYGPYPDFVFTKQPVIPGSLTTLVSGISGTLPAVSWSFYDDAGAYAHSILGQDRIHWNTAVPASSGSIIANYQYNGLIEDLQSRFNNDNQNVLNSDTLIKWASEVPIDITFGIRLLPGFVGSDVTSAASSAVTTLLSTYRIGQEVQQSDIIREVANTPGVDAIIIPLTLFQSQDATILQDAAGNLTIPVYGYAIAGTITVNVV